MRPLSFTDSQLGIILDVAKIVPPKLRKKYLKGIAEELPVHGDIEKVVSGVLVRLDPEMDSATQKQWEAWANALIQSKLESFADIMGAEVTVMFCDLVGSTSNLCRA